MPVRTAWLGEAFCQVVDTNVLVCEAAPDRTLLLKHMLVSSGTLESQRVRVITENPAGVRRAVWTLDLPAQLTAEKLGCHIVLPAGWKMFARVMVFPPYTLGQASLAVVSAYGARLLGVAPP